MALGFYSGLRNRETRIRQRNETLEDAKAASEQWNARFKLQNEEANKTWLERNKITNTQSIQAAELSAAAATDARKDDREFQLDVLALKRAYETDDQAAAQTWWKEQQYILNKYAEQKAVNTDGRLQAWDQTKFERDRAARQEDLRDEIGLRSDAANSQFDYQFGLKTDESKKAAIAAHANEMQQILLKRITEGGVIGADFTAAVGGSGDSMAKIAQYSAGIIALGVNKENPVLAKLAGLNNPAVMKSAFETLQKYHTKIGETGRKNPSALEMFRDGANDFLSSIVITSPDPSQAEAIIKQMESIEGARPLDDLSKSIINMYSNTGSAVATIQPIVVENLARSELGLWEKAITKDAVNRGRGENNNITQALEDANNMSETGDANQQALAKELMDWLGTRKLAITEAVENATSKNPDYFGIVGLYGNSAFAEAALEEPRLESSFLPGYLKEASEATPVEVPNLRVFAKLKDFKIIQKGDLVKLRQPDGTFKIFIYAGE